MRAVTNTWSAGSGLTPNKTLTPNKDYFVSVNVTRIVAASGIAGRLAMGQLEKTRRLNPSPSGGRVSFSLKTASSLLLPS